MLTQLEAAARRSDVAEVVGYLHRPLGSDDVKKACDFPLTKKHENDVWTVGASCALRRARRAWHAKRWAAAVGLTALALPGAAATATVYGILLGALWGATRRTPRPRTQLGVLEDRIAREVKELVLALDWHSGEEPLNAAQVDDDAAAAQGHLERLAGAIQRLPEARLRHSSLILRKLRKARRQVETTRHDLLARLDERQDIVARCGVVVSS